MALLQHADPASGARGPAPRMTLAVAVLAVTLMGPGPAAVDATPSLPSALRGLRRDTAPYKGFTGIRARGDSARKVFFHDQTIAVVEVSMDYNAMDLQNCELIEVNKASVAREALQNLSTIAKPSALGFADMNALMRRCQELDGAGAGGLGPGASQAAATRRKIDDSPDPKSLLSGILPGTKWCGTGDIAANYFDLGTEKDIDRCCRTHDLCPVKVRAFQSRYGLSNMSFYTKSHCICDDMLLTCLKASRRPTANIMGNIYFNLLRVPCVEDVVDAESSRTVRKYRNPKRY
ncbi:Phospholipase A2 isozymes PA3A/PA3B/PA5 [Frankliniella fusca]|uniref:Phospholipase A2 n=1 Tax=Frankliniella fusca TaxID=407009 RepID=A0AAE1GV72_9NEOP|nr:Phospholipase A2 isozymes PA3A/PA3B/PA5 [Frankliniella fusca]